MDAVVAQNSTNVYLKTQQNQSAGKINVISAIEAASARTGVDFAYLLNKADQESSLNPNAKAGTSSASGLFQFIKTTWLKMVKDHGAEYGMGEEAKAITEKNGKLSVDDPAMREKILNMRHDPVLSSAMAAEFTKGNKDYLDASVGGNIGSTELYMAHFLGAGGASTFLKALKASPNANAAELMPDAANANRSVFYNKSGQALSVSEIYQRFSAKFDKPLSIFAASAQPAPEHVLQRDLASLSPSFYHPPSSDVPVVNMDMFRDIMKINNTTAGTLFNTMMIAQTNMKDLLLGASGQNEKRK